MSYQDAAWEWRRESKEGHPCYQLIRSSSAQPLADRLKVQAQSDFEAQARTMIGALNMPPDRIAAAAKNNPDVADLLKDDRLHAGLATFAQALSPEEQSAILRGQVSVQVPVSRLSDEGKAFIKSE